MASRTAASRPKEALPPIRFEATLGPAPRTRALAAAAELALDRLPDVDRAVRLLLTPDDARRLLEQGFEVHLLAAVPVKPLDKSLVMSERQSRDWLDEQLRGVARKGGR